MALCGSRFLYGKFLKSYLYSATQHQPLSVQPQASFVTGNTGLEIEYISCIDDRLCTERQAEGRQALRYEDAQARIINGQSPPKWIDGKNCGLRGKAKDRSNAGPGFQIRF